MYDYVDECETCDREFGSRQAAIQHMNALGHWAVRYECETCDEDFSTQSSADRHMDDWEHWMPEFECDICDLRFHTQRLAEEHMDDLDHHERFSCYECNKTFKNENALQMHLNSGVHRGKNILCPFCQAAYTSATGLTHHLETGSCQRASNINYRTVFKAVSQRDKRGLLTNKLLTYPDSDTPTIATNATWNGSSFECYLCHRGYRTRRALDQHLNSPAHSEKLYHCPNGSCDRQFPRLAALFNHLESESCKFIRFEQVQQHVHKIISGRRNQISFT